MKAFVAILILAALGGLVGCSGASSAKIDMTGTWINDQQMNNWHVQRVVINADGSWQNYYDADGSTPTDAGNQPFKIVKRWTDSAGNVFFTEYGPTPGGWTRVELSKLSKGGTVWETVAIYDKGDVVPDQFPTKIDPRNPTYRMLYRKK